MGFARARLVWPRDQPGMARTLVHGANAVLTDPRVSQREPGVRSVMPSKNKKTPKPAELLSLDEMRARVKRAWLLERMIANWGEVTAAGALGNAALLIAMQKELRDLGFNDLSLYFEVNLQEEPEEWMTDMMGIFERSLRALILDDPPAEKQGNGKAKRKAKGKKKGHGQGRAGNADTIRDPETNRHVERSSGRGKKIVADEAQRLAELTKHRGGGAAKAPGPGGAVADPAAVQGDRAGQPAAGDPAGKRRAHRKHQAGRRSSGSDAAVAERSATGAGDPAV